MPFPYSISFTINELYGAKRQTVTLYSGLTSLIGPNGSGKSQVLRALKERLSSVTAGRIVRDDRPFYYSSLSSSGRILTANEERLTTMAPITEVNNIAVSVTRQNSIWRFSHIKHSPRYPDKSRKRLRRLFHRDVNIEYDAGNLRFVFSRLDTGWR